MGYTPTLTLPSTRKAVAESLNRRFGMDYTADHIFMTTARRVRWPMLCAASACPGRTS